MDDFMELTSTKREAILPYEDSLLIMADDDYGNNKVLTNQVTKLLANGVAPENILFIPSVNRAIVEVRDSIAKMFGINSKDLWACTFHSLCARILRREIEATGIYRKNFVIYDDNDINSLVKKCIKQMKLNDECNTPIGVWRAISNIKMKMMGPMEFSQYANNNGNFHHKKISEIYSLYQSKLQESNALDFDDLLLITISLIRDHEEIRTRYQQLFRYILVDEHEIINKLQYQLIKLLAGEKRCFTVRNVDQVI
ncbi:UvrD-helicase domain-containing protein [uncultured Anaerovibrio sp.]|uniref:UvrD-helicase domain-containing protein n=1 Tax=uncultured Anaerovibrio sp. TaxID=361586 RepID=UPI0025D937B4|nr:UvrD-helicase domain-containing protein [uncultured Anaerovibrio sp.]